MEELLQKAQSFKAYGPLGLRKLIWSDSKHFLPYGLVGIENPKVQQLALYSASQTTQVANELLRLQIANPKYQKPLIADLKNLPKPIDIDSFVVGRIYIVPTRDTLYLKLLRIIELDRKIETKYVERVKQFAGNNSTMCDIVLTGNISHIYEFSLGNIKDINLIYGKFNSTKIEIYNAKTNIPKVSELADILRNKFMEPLSFLMDLVMSGDAYYELNLSLVVRNNITIKNVGLSCKESFPNIYYDAAGVKAPDGSNLLDGMTFNDKYGDVPFVENRPNNKLIQTIMDEANLDSDVVAQVVSIFKNEPDYYINLSDDSGDSDDDSASAGAGVNRTGGGDDNTIFTIRFYIVMLIFLLILLVFLVYNMKPKEDTTLNLKKYIYTPN